MHYPFCLSANFSPGMNAEAEARVRREADTMALVVAINVSATRSVRNGCEEHNQFAISPI